MTWKQKHDDSYYRNAVAKQGRSRAFLERRPWEKRPQELDHHIKQGDLT